MIIDLWVYKVDDLQVVVVGGEICVDNIDVIGDEVCVIDGGCVDIDLVFFYYSYFNFDYNNVVVNN